MSIKSFYVRKMLLQYDKQLVADRRIRRHMQLLGPSEVDPEQKRQLMVERVAQEVFENLLFSGSNNPVVEDVKKSLENELGEKLSFKFPPSKLDFEIYRETQDGPVKIDPSETSGLLSRLWSITLEKVDETML
ncbi:MAG: hypothetical protein IJD04_08380 [Desulfovibrionaceae bacterium]|nr:hypothetical protein [Desulfovibrionaceae bacterium]